MTSGSGLKRASDGGVVVYRRTRQRTGKAPAEEQCSGSRDRGNSSFAANVVPAVESVVSRESSRSGSSPRKHGRISSGEHEQHSQPQWQSIKDGRLEAQKVVNELESKSTEPNDELDGDERDPVGANPLHLSVLYSKSRHRDQRHSSNSRALGWEETEEHERYAKEIWNSAKLRHLRTQEYDRGDYEGETALHLAIGKRNGGLVKHFLDNCNDEEKKLLVESRVVGSFDIAHFTTSDGQKRCKFGEHALCWAACTNQLEIVDLLIEHKARADCKTLYGDTILHMLVRWSGWLEEDMPDNED